MRHVEGSDRAMSRRAFVSATAAAVAGLSTMESIDCALAQARQEGVEGQVIHVTDATFEEEVLRSVNPVLVDFYADWCGPCRAVKPVLKKLAREYAKKFKIVEINVDTNTVDSAYNVTAIPNFYVIKDGKTVDHFIGGGPIEFFRSKLNKVLNANEGR